MSNSDIRLLMYSPLSLRMGAGGDRWLAEIAPRLKRRGIQPTVLATDFVAKNYRGNLTDWFVKQVTDAGIQYQETPASSFSNRVNFPIMGGSSFTKLVREMHLHDITYFMNAYFLQDISTWLAKRRAKHPPVISAQHATLFQDDPFHNAYIRIITRRLLKVFDAFHVLNREDYMTYSQWGLSPTFLIQNGVDTKKFIPAFSKDETTFTVLFAGRLDYQKGIDTLLGAIQYLERDFSSEIAFKICGSGPMVQSVERFANTRSHVQYLGYVPEGDLMKLYKTASLFLMPSRRETFGLAALEAMASGTPVVVSDIAGPRSFVRESFGRKIPPMNPQALADEIRWFSHLFTERPEELKAMAKSARDICVKEFDWDRVAAKIEQMIRKIATVRSEA